MLFVGIEIRQMISLGRHLFESLQRTLWSEVQLAVALESDPEDIVEWSIVPQAFGNRKHALFALCTNDDVNVRSLQSLSWQ